MNHRKINKKIDEAANTAKRLVAKVTDSRIAAEELAEAAIEGTQAALVQASKKGEHRVTEQISKAGHRVQETVTKLANRAEEWADKATSRADSAARSGQRAARKHVQRSKRP